MAQLQQDQFIDDDEEETCPLCIEELDLSDRNFRPCVCGYQICQFCYNNIKNQGGGRCPACRREYNDATIEWKSIGPEEVARYKANQANKAKKQAAAKQKEAQKREADSLKRAHLAGLRVVQKNLVYVTGLNPKVQEQQLLDTLRGDQYFGQYGKIIKIVVSKAKQATNPPQSVGVYVTFERKDDAAACIAAVDGSQNGDRTLRAQFGTTKYCSAYLRGDLCQNRNCMFLHEAAEENDSFTRHDLSSMNAASSQRPPGPTGAPPRQSQPPPQSQQPVSAASQPMQRDGSGDGISSPSSSAPDHPGLPSSASWANRALQSSRRGSVATGSSNPSPLVSKAEPAVSLPAVEPAKPAEPIPAAPAASAVAPTSTDRKVSQSSAKVSATSSSKSPFDQLMTALNNPEFSFSFSASSLSKDDLKIVMNMPPLFDPNGGAKRRKFKEQEAERRRQLAAAQATAHAGTTTDVEDAAEAVGGSLQLGGEPEERAGVGLAPQRNASQLPPQFTTQHTLGGLTEEISNLSLARGLTPQQQQHQLQLQQLRAVNPQSANLLSNLQQPGFQQAGQASGHARGQSRFSFANDNGSASASIKPVANAKLMSQQSSMMPQQASAPYNQMSSQFGQNFNSGMPGPPPGLKQTGTPPMSGPQRFGQGIGFGGDNSRLAYGAGGQEALLRDMMHGQRAAASQVSDASKREYNLSSLLHHSHQQSHQQYPSTSSTPASVGPAPGHNLLGFPYGGPPASGYADSVASSQKQKKKGKKHRHANTSSSGGGVVNDLADPSILQARLQQQHASQAGLYGAGSGQGAGVPGDPFTVQRLPQPPPGLQQQPEIERHASPEAKGLTRRQTPTIPPGFDKPDPTPAEAAAAAAAGTSKQRTVGKSRAGSAAIITPAVPTLAPARVGTPLRREIAQSKPEDHEQILGQHFPTDEPQKETASPVTKLDGDLTIPKLRSTAQHLRDGPKPKEPVADEPADDGTAPAAVVLSGASEVAETSAVKSKVVAPTSTKRQAPGKLDIGAASRVLDISNTGETSKPGLTGKDSRPPTPAAVSTGSPIKRTVAPRTLRVVSTPKTEMPPSSTAVPALPPIVGTAGPSRKGSIASINLPGTPGQDISDSMSVTSTSVSMSRASSPPPAKKTKSQVMRERKEKAAAKLATTEDVVLKRDEPIIAPILGRKKKEKKAKDKGPVALVKKEESRPETPDADTTSRADSDDSPAVDSPAGHAEHPHLDHEADVIDSPVSDQPEEKRYISAAMALKDLQGRGELDIASLEMLKGNPSAVSSQLRHDSRVRFEGSDFANALRLPDPFNDEAESNFADHETVRWVEGQHTDRLSARNLVTPAGTWLKMLSADEEARYLALEERLRSESDANPVGLWQRSGIDDKLAQLIAANSSLPNIRRFYDSTFDPDQFTQHLDAPLEASSVLPPTADRPTPLLPNAAEAFSATPQIPVTNKVPSADEALQYVNQYILPTVSLPHPQTSKAAEAIYLGSAMPSKNRYDNGTAQAPGFIVEDSSYRFVGVGGEPALVGSVGPSSTSATLSAAAASAASRTQAAGYVGVGQGPGTVDAWTAMHRLTSARGMGKVRGYSDWYEGCPVPELGWSGRLFANVAEMERAVQESKRETEGLEKKLMGLFKKNRRLVGLEKGGSGVVAH